MKDINDLYIIKFSEPKYLEELKNGKLYFKEAKYFKRIEENNVGDSREGKLRVDPKTIPQNNIMKGFFTEDTEFNYYLKRREKTPIFCSSIINKKVFRQIDNSNYEFRKEFIKEMKKWGKFFIVINVSELLSKLSTVCDKKGISFIADKIIYDQEKRILTFNEAVIESNFNEYESYFHKCNRYKWQNEFRIILYDEKTELIPKDRDHYVLDIGELCDSKIYYFDKLEDMRFKIIEKGN